MLSLLSAILLLGFHGLGSGDEWGSWLGLQSELSAFPCIVTALQKDFQFTLKGFYNDFIFKEKKKSTALGCNATLNLGLYIISSSSFKA